MKILIIIDDLRAGGTENVLASRLNELHGKLEVRIVTLFALGPVSERIKESGIRVEFLDMKNFGISKTFSKIRTIIENEKFDIAICMRDISKALFPRFLKKYIPSVVMLWDSPVIKRSFKQSWMEWYQVKFSGAIPYCSSRNTAEALYKTYKLIDVKVIPNCYDSKRFKKREKQSVGTFHIISIGGVRKEKNYMDKLIIAENLKQKDFKFKLSIIGEDPEGIIQREIIKCRLEDQVICLGVRKDVPEQLQEADLFIFTSSSEGFPVALIEAMAVGLPCVSYEFPSLKEIDNNFSKIAVVEQGDTESAAEKIIDLSKNNSKATSMGEEASKHISARFSSDVNAKEWIDFLEDVRKQQN